MKLSELFKRSPLVALLVLTVTGCLSLKPTPDPTQFYVLSSVANQSDPKLPADSEIRICIAGVSAPAYLDVPWIVTRNGDNQVHRASFHQWAEPVADGLSRVLVENLGTILDTSDILVLSRERAGESRFFVKLSIAKFDLSTSGEATVKASWRIRNSKFATFEMNNRFERTMPFEWDSSDYGVAVGQLNQLMTEICKVISDDILMSKLL